MKKIFVITKVKNESDIIESFCRYNLTYCDGMLICDNESLDNTRIIIQTLIDEGLPIHLIEDKTASRTVLAKKTIDEYGADLIVNLDADEFLYHTEGHNPRAVLETLCEDIEYHVYWRTYVYQREPENIGQDFLPNFFTSYRNPVLDSIHAGKVIVSKYLIQEKQVIIGAHCLKYPSEHNNSWRPIVIEQPPKLVCAHFPLRSKAQLMTKVIPTHISHLKNPIPLRIHHQGQTTLGFYCKDLFNEIRDNGDISTERIRQRSIEYSLRKPQFEKILPEIENCLTIEGSMDVSFCADKLHLRYTNYKDADKTLLRTTLTEFESALAALPGREAETVKMFNELKKLTDGYNLAHRAISFVLQNIFKVAKKLRGY